MHKLKALLLTIILGTTLSLSILVFASSSADTFIYLPIVQRPPETLTELRGIWITRYDWTTLYDGANPETAADIDAMVQTIADAGFNAIFFQVRSEADAYYASTLEPWSRRLAGTLGADPGWDPLARMIEQAHARNIQVHAYVNVYTLWSDLNLDGLNIDCNELPSGTAVPQHLYYQLQGQYGVTDSKLNATQWLNTGEVVCSDGYLWVSPAATNFDNHMVAVAKEIINNYAVDGLHLDRIRYGNINASCDPVSATAFGSSCFATSGYGDWQRNNVNNLVARIYNEAVVPASRPVLLSAAVWPIHELDPTWTNFAGSPQQGNVLYYQDSKAWVHSGTIDSLAPMIYPSNYNGCDTEGNYIEDPGISSTDYWTQDRWQTLVDDFVADSNGRFIIPGIGGNYCSFAEIEARIDMARAAGAAGHALFSYRHLESRAYFDDLKNGPYAQPAIPPEITWRP